MHAQERNEQMNCLRYTTLKSKSLSFITSFQLNKKIPLYSKTLHIFVFLASTVALTSLTVLFFSLMDQSDVNHLVNLTFPRRNQMSIILMKERNLVERPTIEI